MGVGVAQPVQVATVTAVETVYEEVSRMSPIEARKLAVKPPHRYYNRE
jgi:hypothetical protein